MADVVRAAQANFGWDQELPFTAFALAHYLPPARAWTNKYGQQIDFDRICKRLCDLPLGEGACFGTHNLYALAALLAADDRHGILSDDTRARTTAVLRQAATLLERSQSPEGCWNRNWPRGEIPGEKDAGTEPLSVLVVTSHSLEWLAIAPRSLAFDERRVTRAIEGLVEQTLKETPARLEQIYGVYSHVGTALQAWAPAVWRELLPTSSTSL